MVDWNKSYGGRALRTAVGITALGLLMAGGAGAATPISACTTISLPGEYILNTNILNSGVSSCINITSNDVIFDGASYTIDGIDSMNTYGVFVHNSTIALTNITIKNLNLLDWANGIYLNNSINNTIIYNNVGSNIWNGILLEYSNNNKLIGNSVTNNNWGISLYSSNNNNLSGNNAKSNLYIGIYLANYYLGSNNNTLIGNNASKNGNGINLGQANSNILIENKALDNDWGISLWDSRNNLLTSNIANSNTNDGISLGSSSNNNILSWNNATNNRIGLHLQSSMNNDIFGNNITSNNYDGTHLSDSSNNKIYNNYMDNDNNAWDNGNNIWNITKTAGKNIIGGPYLGGNLWAYPDGTGFSQTCAYSNSDGICDSSYTLFSNNIDYLPLAFNASPSGGGIPIQIDSPMNNSSFLQGEIISFSGNASGGTAPYDYSWTSNIDGFIGNVSSIYTPPWEGNRTHILNFSLSTGTHVITMTVNDSGGLTNSTATTITINPASTINISGQSATGVMTWNAVNFPALTTETLNVVSLTGRTIMRFGLRYNTAKQLVPYKVFSATGNTVERGLDASGNKATSGGGYYAKVGWFGKTYVALKGQTRKLAKLILEQNETENKTLLVGETWDIGDGYTLKLNSIDSGALPWQALVTLNKSGTQLGYKVAQNFTVYTYVAPSMGHESDVPMFVTYFDNISTNSVRLKYTWLISGNNILELSAGDRIGNLEVWTASTENINMTNTSCSYISPIMETKKYNIDCY